MRSFSFLPSSFDIRYRFNEISFRRDDRAYIIPPLLIIHSITNLFGVLFTREFCLIAISISIAISQTAVGLVTRCENISRYLFFTRIMHARMILSVQTIARTRPPNRKYRNNMDYWFPFYHNTVLYLKRYLFLGPLSAIIQRWKIQWPFFSWRSY